MSHVTFSTQPEKLCLDSIQLLLPHLEKHYELHGDHNWQHQTKQLSFSSLLCLNLSNTTQFIVGPSTDSISIFPSSKLFNVSKGVSQTLSELALFKNFQSYFVYTLQSSSNEYLICTFICSFLKTEFKLSSNITVK